MISEGPTPDDETVSSSPCQRNDTPLHTGLSRPNALSRECQRLEVVSTHRDKQKEVWRLQETKPARRCWANNGLRGKVKKEKYILVQTLSLHIMWLWPSQCISRSLKVLRLSHGRARLDGRRGLFMMWSTIIRLTVYYFIEKSLESQTFHFIYFFERFYFSQVISTPKVGLELTARKLRVACSTDGTNQVPHSLPILFF